MGLSEVTREARFAATSLVRIFRTPIGRILAFGTIQAGVR